MERAGKLIARLRLPSGCLAPEELACAAWRQVVGPRIAAHTCALRVRESVLQVDVEDPVWQAQLTTLRGQILARLNQVLGRELVRGVEFRLAIPRRPPRRAERIQAARDEADGIQDPSLRLIYKAARRRSSA